MVSVFERFTDRARRVLVLAQEEARLLNHNFIGTEHVLLGLLHEGEGIAAKALTSLGVALETVREEVEETIGPSGSSTTGSPPFTPRAKKVLELSLREALQLGHLYIGTEHLLLGLLREGEGVGTQVLVGLGVDLARVRYQVIHLLGDPPTETTAEATTMTEASSRQGPRCPTCQSPLEDHVRYRVLPVRPEAGDESRTIDVAFVYCLLCGVVVAHRPTGDFGGKRRPGDGTLSAEAERAPAAPDEERLIAEGVTDDGVRWALQAGGDDESYSTVLHLEDQSGATSGGGMGGPKLSNDDVMNVYSSQTDDGPLAIVVRTDPSIVRVILVTHDGAERDLPPCRDAPIDGLRFYVGFARPVLAVDTQRPRFGLREVRGLNTDDTIRETYDLSFWDTRLGGRS